MTAPALGISTDPGTVPELLAGRRLVVLTGAGLSTDSGIPDYRGPGSRPRNPMTYSEFVSGEPAQRRYWARSHVGWARMRRADPNPGHVALAALGAAGLVERLITQNVDGLHEAAGHRGVIDLHGRIDEVVCLDCRRLSPRDELQARLTASNPGFTEAHSAQVETAPDGDAAVEITDGFRIVPCASCGGTLKPHVVFFGENVPKDRVARCYAAVAALTPDDALLVAGSSLQVMSGLRFVRAAWKAGVPVVIVNRGATRGDDLATVRVDAGCSETLAALAACPL
ncbi:MULTISPECIES: NAD-dependent protein deacetylase [Pseudonocardia]|uniref:NAD-dependent protein deacetylase n=2 Tax=Pseudonocardia TaxID=1847 RepID=A0A1Y2MWT4_PSEAH|nr:MULTISPECIES: NAD-dependent protein deacetylase [Pseudonocardia]OSY39635.1 NAD-dependent protein deacetylase [Pseudonocardia autotrophica]TDN72766.1 NAD-dependent SIR2 family protein deacetylase [Pseudonocardia autotrophica]BBG03481.1 NAD-dependent protein deacetylase [Pseudonocardia autotrophica]GEC24901.1 NAD-dependent protein deacetylase [Pseudonocardia saturnea]